MILGIALTDSTACTHAQTPYSSQNFRTIIEYISDSKKPVVVHNGIFDICHTFDQFWDYLPNDVLEFKKRVTEMWPL